MELSTGAATLLGPEHCKDAPVAPVLWALFHLGPFFEPNHCSANMITTSIFCDFSIKNGSKGLWSQTALFYLTEYACFLIFFYKTPLAALPKLPLFTGKISLKAKVEEKSHSQSSLTSENTCAGLRKSSGCYSCGMFLTMISITRDCI